MTPSPVLNLSDKIRQAQRDGRPIVALESTVISHGLPWPINLETVGEVEAAVRSTGAVPATIALIDGAIGVGVGQSDLDRLARGDDISKASPPPEEHSLPRDELEREIAAAVAAPEAAGVRGKAVTPFLLDEVRRRTGGRALAVNRALLVNNARLAAEIAMALRSVAK